jgi:hypothetical protein
MLGRPAMSVPVFMNVWAGSWLIASVCIELMMQMLSAIEPMWGNSSEMFCPLLPNVLKSYCAPRQRNSLPWSCAIGWPFVNESGIGLPVISRSLGLKSNVSRCVGPPAMYR